MDSNELREACEMADMQITDQPGGKWHAVTPFAEGQIGADVFVYKQADPALKPYVAELLTTRDEITEYTVSEMDTKRVPYKYQCEVLSSELEKHKGTGDTPAEAIIRAAMDAIGATTEECT